VCEGTEQSRKSYGDRRTSDVVKAFGRRPPCSRIVLVGRHPKPFTRAAIVETSCEDLNIRSRE
jgi:hypothetical protein